MNETELEQSISNKIAAWQTTTSAASQPWSPPLIEFLGTSILVFCLIALGIAAYMLRGRDTTDGMIVIKVFGITLIVCVSAFLMIVGYGEGQLTPIVGLFGAIAGYILGKEKR
jgi:glycerol uptake facilitator-like aquaporin